MYEKIDQVVKGSYTPQLFLLALSPFSGAQVKAEEDSVARQFVGAKFDVVRNISYFLNIFG